MPLKLIGINKSFGDKTIFSQFDYTFNDTGIYAIIGESGIGKTTLLRIISGLDTQFTGEVIPNDNDVSFAFQEYRLFPQLNALENVYYAVSGRKDKAVIENAKNLLLRLGFNESDIFLLPGELSGGMKQRVSLARAFLHDAPILILDEPTKELDEKNTEVVRKIISEQAQKRLVIIVSHNKEDVSLLNATEISL